MNIGLFGLLHVKEGERSAPNLMPKNFRDQITIYLGNALTLSNSLSEKGLSFTLLTNDKAFMRECLPSASYSLSIEEIPFTTIVPTGIGFYSAHFKIDAFKYLASLSDGYYALCDLDMVCIQDFPQGLQNIINAGIPLCYDISDQVLPAFGQEVFLQDLKILNGLESEGRYLGGEFISGTPEFFQALTSEIGAIYENYIKSLNRLHSFGDEIITSAAVEKMKRHGMYIADAGSVGIVGRFWNANTLHPQKPFEYFKTCFLLHLPSDKRFLANLAQAGVIEKDKFFILYSRQRNSIKRILKRFGGQILHFASEIFTNNGLNR